MERIGILAERPHRYELAVQASGIGERKAIAAARLSAAHDLARAGGALITPRSMLPRAAAISGGGSAPAETDPETEAPSTGTLERMGAPPAADTVWTAAAFAWAAPRHRDARP